MSEMRQGGKDVFVTTLTTFANWTIRDFNRVPSFETHSFTSPVFRFLDADWSLVLTAQRHGDHDDSAENVELQLFNVCHRISVYYFYAQMEIRDSYRNVILRWSENCRIPVDKDELGKEKRVISVKLLCENEDEVLSVSVILSKTGRVPDLETQLALTEQGVFSISTGLLEESSNKTCENPELCVVSNITQDEQCESSVSSECLEDEESNEGLETLSKNLKDLILGECLCDVKIRMQGTDFLAHKAILAARSPVFQTMLENDTVEKQSRIIEICDCSPAAFAEFVHYLYTGRTVALPQENVCVVYRLADEYRVKHLKKECIAAMMRDLNDDSFCDVISLAVKYNISELVDIATEFFVRHAKRMLPTEKWQTFMAENIALASDLFLKALNKT